MPRQGSLIIVTARGGVTGDVAGEPLHFENDEALAAVPLGARDSIEVQVLVRQGGVIEGNTTVVPIAARSQSKERIRAAERFTTPPDSALQVRLARERGLSREAARGAHDLPRLWTKPFIRPRDARVTSRFGGGREINGVAQSTHYGLDLAGRKGAPVHASNRGVVALVGDFFYGGTSIYLHHGDGLMTVYNHLSKALVVAGDTVERGQIIGRVGATGRVTGPHLHWTAQYGSIPFDPLDLLILSH